MSADLDVVVTEPGLYPGMSDAWYHGDPVPGGSLSVTGAKKLLPPHCPAVFAYEREHGRPNRRTYDVGHAAHLMVLGEGPELAVVQADNWLTKAAKTKREEAYTAGKIPVLRKEFDQVNAMASAITADPIAGRLLDPGRGIAEASGFWHDQIWRRFRMDFVIPATSADSRAVIVDYKTTAESAHPDEVSRAIARYRYYMQAPWYIDGLTAVAARAGFSIGRGIEFVFCFQQKTPPFIPTCVRLSIEDIQAGRIACDAAVQRYRDCTEAGVWPGYVTDDIPVISLPRWARRDWED